jgi:3-hydroxy-9,10-secoandrosta-1,3,5(10)-triene-9,17-dione monooxygenase reductase component
MIMADNASTPGSKADFDPRVFRTAMGQFSTGIVVATGCLDGKPAGFAAQSFVSLSLDPPLIALCPGKSSTSWPKLRDSGHFCINILSDEQKPLCDHFAMSGGDKFADLTWRAGVSGSPVLADVLAYVDCKLEAEHDAGDHTIAVGRVLDFKLLAAEDSPLLFFRGGYGQFEALSS